MRGGGGGVQRNRKFHTEGKDLLESGREGGLARGLE